MALQNNPNNPYAVFPGATQSGCLVSMIGGVRTTQDGLIIVSDRTNNRTLAVLDPADFPGQHANNPDLILRDLNRMVAQYNSGRKVVLPAWAVAALD